MLPSCDTQYAPNLILQLGYAYDYDFNGNRLTKTNSTNTERELYEWEYRNRLTSVTQQTYNAETGTWENVQIVEYTYDYNNVWIRKIIGNDKTIFIPENYQTVAQIDNGAITHHYLWTPNAQDKLLADVTTNDVLWALTDHLGTIRDIIGTTTNTHIIYDAYGNIISGTNPILFGYTGKAFDVSTQLQNNINRWYDATTGRWLSIDPIGFYGGDTNLYRYVNNTPNIYNDYLAMATQGFQFTDINMRDNEIQKILNDNKRKPIGKKDKNCVRISIILELTDSMLSQEDPGHVGIGIGKDFYDFGPPPGEYINPTISMLLGVEKSKTVPGRKWWDEENFDMNKRLSNHIKDIKKANPDYAFVMFNIYVCKERATEIKNYWERLYKAIDSGKAKYSVPGLHCTSTVLCSFLGQRLSASLARISPGMLFGMLANSDDPRFYHSCGENKGKPAEMKVL